MSSDVVKSPGVGNRRSGQSDKQKLAQGEAMLSDYIAGMKQSELMEKYQVSSPTVQRRLKLALDSRIAPTVDRYRDQQNAHLDDLMAHSNQALLEAQELIRIYASTASAVGVERALDKKLQAIDRMLRINERRARLNGLDMPVQVQTTSIDTGAETQQRMSAMLTAARLAAEGQGLGSGETITGDVEEGDGPKGPDHTDTTDHGRDDSGDQEPGTDLVPVDR